MRGLFFLVFLFSVAFLEPEKGPGLSIAANPEFFRKATDIVTPIIISALRGLAVNASGYVNLTVFGLTYRLHTFKINDINLNKEGTVVTMENDVMNVSVSDLTLDCYGKGNFSTVPELFFGEGEGKVLLSHLNSKVSLNFEKNPENNLPKLVLHNYTFDVNEKNVQSRFSGTNDIFTLLDMAGNATIPMIIKMLGKNATKEDRETIQDTVNGLLSNIPDAIAIPDTDVVFNFSLADSPRIQSGFAQLALTGSSACANASVCKTSPEPAPVPPPYIKPFSGSGNLQLLISDYLFNSLLRAAFEDSLLNLEISSGMVHNMTNGSLELDTEMLSLFIPEVKKEYPDKKPVDLIIAFTAPPTVDIKTTGMTLKSAILITVNVETEPGHREKLFDIQLNFQINDFKAWITKNLFYGVINDYVFTLDLKYSKIDNVKIKDVESLFNAIFKIAIPQINSYLKDGIPLPIIKPFFSLSKSELTMLDRYIRVDFTPEPCMERMGEFIELAASKLVESYKRVMRTRRLKRLKPHSMPTWLKIEYQLHPHTLIRCFIR